MPAMRKVVSREAVEEASVDVFMTPD